MKFSIVIPSLLAHYRTAASGREQKIIRAVNSVLSQTFQDFEVIVVADGCEATVKIMNQVTDERVSTFLIPRNKTWSGAPRSKGIEEARGDYIVYLDIDDMYGENHLKAISDQLVLYDWVWFNDIRYSVRLKEWYENPCNIHQIGAHGTSNICHKRTLPAKWDRTGYAHDYHFVNYLKQNSNYAKINGCEYYVMHIPNSTIGRGYDL